MPSKRIIGEKGWKEAKNKERDEGLQHIPQQLRIPQKLIGER